MINFNELLKIVIDLVVRFMSSPLGNHLLTSAKEDPMFWATIFTLWITLKTLLQTALANELKLLPLLVISIKGKSFEDKRFHIKNMGEGVAYRIKIEVFALILTDVQKVWSLQLKLGGTNVLGRDDERKLAVYDHEDKKTSDNTSFLTIWLGEGEKREDITLLVTFYNSLGNKYCSLLEFGRDGLTIAMPPRRSNFRLRVFLLVRRARSFLRITFWRIVWRFRKPYIARPKG